MQKLLLNSNSSKETLKIGKALAKQLTTGDTVVLSGELGAGKTKFVEGFLEYFGLQNEISSPTFNIINEYNTSNINIYHFDVYRLEDCDEFYAIGGEEYFDKGICLIEWGELIKDVLPNKYIQINLIKDENNENKRILELIINFNSDILNKLKEEFN